MDGQRKTLINAAVEVGGDGEVHKRLAAVEVEVGGDDALMQSTNILQQQQWKRGGGSNPRTYCSCGKGGGGRNPETSCCGGGRG